MPNIHLYLYPVSKDVLSDHINLYERTGNFLTQESLMMFGEDKTQIDLANNES